MDYDQLLTSLTPELVDRLRAAVETGRWPDGREVTAAQREHSLQAVIAWESRHLPPEERVGFVDKRRKEAARSPSAPDTLRWADQSGDDS
jgi:uncharacterized protein YeaC (DUF1315 family)